MHRTSVNKVSAEVKPFKRNQAKVSTAGGRLTLHDFLVLRLRFVSSLQ